MKPPEVLLRSLTQEVYRTTCFNLCGEFAASHGDLFAALDVLEGEVVGLHFVLAHDEHVAHPSFAGNLERLFQTERFIAQLCGTVLASKLAGKLGRRAIHPCAERSDVYVGLADRRLGRLRQRHHKTVLTNRESDARSMRSAQRLRKPVIAASAKNRILRPERAVG